MAEAGRLVPAVGTSPRVGFLFSPSVHEASLSIFLGLWCDEREKKKKKTFEKNNFVFLSCC